MHFCLLFESFLQVVLSTDYLFAVLNQMGIVSVELRQVLLRFFDDELWGQSEAEWSASVCLSANYDL